MNRNILFINPWIYDFSAYDCWNQPIGLLSLASLLRENGWNGYFLDCLDPYHPAMQNDQTHPPPKRRSSGEGKYAMEYVPKPTALNQVPRNYHRYGITPDLFLSSIASMPKPDLVMVTSMMTYWYPGVFEVIKLIRQAIPGAPVILGGNYVTLCPQHASRSGADFCIAGPAEDSLPELMKTLCNQDLQVLPDPDRLDSYPYPAFDLLSHPVQVPIMTSRGCPYRCSYCASHLTTDHFRRREPLGVANEIEHWHRTLGINHFSFYDDALLVHPQEMAIPLLKELIHRKLPIQFHCPNGLHLREITAEVSTLMHKAGFRTIRFGFETSDRIRQKTTGGKVDNDEFLEAIGHLVQAGYDRRDIGVYLLCGLPGQSAQEVEESIRFVKQSRVRPIIAEYSPIPGTGLWLDSLAASPYPLADEPLFQNNTLLPCRNDSLTYAMYQRLKLLCRE
ncbi:MAG: radical SAM protein [Deltaproteobacteria bacterium]|nr:radical SAM protein [Deltaproteobacteria bacterium]